MTNAHSFPLLRLPNLAREHVVKLMEVREQYIFATLSRKSKIVAKIGVRQLSYYFDVTLTLSYITVVLRNAGTKSRLVIKIRSIHATNIVVQDDIELMVEDILETSMEQLTFLIDIFKISKFEIASCRIPNESTKQFLALVRDFSVGIDQLKVAGENPDNEMFAWVMENCRDVKRLSNWISTTKDFQWDSQEPFTSEYISLNKAPYLTVDHLTRLFMNCRFFDIHFYEHQLEVNDLNQLVKVWMNDSRMEFMRIGMKVTHDLNEIVQDIEKEPIHEAYIENSFDSFGAGEAYKIRQQCGKEAVVCKSVWGFIITSHFDNPRCDFWHVVSRNRFEDEEEQSDDQEEEEDN